MTKAQDQHDATTMHRVLMLLEDRNAGPNACANIGLSVLGAALPDVDDAGDALNAGVEVLLIMALSAARDRKAVVAGVLGIVRAVAEDFGVVVDMPG